MINRSIKSYHSRVIGVVCRHWEQSLSIRSVVALDSGKIDRTRNVALFGMTAAYQYTN